MTDTVRNLDATELGKFEKLASEWWDPAGSLRTLHDINPARLEYIAQTTPLSGKTVLDVGCGGGLLAEAMALKGARVTGIDASESLISAATLHARQGEVNINYLCTTAEEFSGQHAAAFDVITCMELLEHVPDVPSLLSACAGMLKPGGHLFLSTINRTVKAYLSAVIGAEYLLGLLPRGTHQYEKFITPAELANSLRKSGLTLLDIAGMHYLPWLKRVMISNSPSVNYLGYARLKS